MQGLKFSLHDTVTIVTSGESGSVVARAEYIAAEPSYLVRYKRADGVATEAWWPESALLQQ